MEYSKNTPDDFGGLSCDRGRLVDRREALRWVGAIGVAGLVAGCSSDPAAAPTTETTAATAATGIDARSTASSSAPSSSSSSSSVTAAEIEVSPGAEIPDETAGPFPADGSNGPNVLEIEGVVRSDLTTSIGDLDGLAEGVPTVIQLTVVDASTGSPRPGAAIYLWHCTADGRYSVYEIAEQNYLRGMQGADEAGRVTFTTIFPGCYPGRWPHCHFEVYDSLDDADAGHQAVKTSQLAIPQADCEAVYGDGRYGASNANLSQLSLAGDNVFADGWEDQLATAAGSVADGYTLSLLVRV